MSRPSWMEGETMTQAELDRPSWQRTLGRVGPRELNDMQRLEVRLKGRRPFVVRAPKAKAGPAGVPLPAGLRWRWKDDDGHMVEIVVLPGDGRSYRASMTGESARGTTTLEQLRAWYEARV